MRVVAIFSLDLNVTIRKEYVHIRGIERPPSFIENGGDSLRPAF